MLNKLKHIKNISLPIVLLLGYLAYAQGPPITLTAPGTLGFQGSAVRTFGMVSSTEDVKSYTHVIAVPYNITTNFQVGLIGRYTFVNPSNANAFNGFNNTTLFLKHQLFVVNETAKTFRVSGLARQTFPTAKRPIAQEIYSTYLGFALGDISTKRGFYSNLGYVINSNNVSDGIQYDFSVGIPLLPQVYPLKQLNTFIEVNGNKAIQNNNHLLFLSPGLQFIKGSFLIESNIQLPIIEENASNSTTNFKVLLGARILI